MEKRKGWEELKHNSEYVGGVEMQYKHFAGSVLAMTILADKLENIITRGEGRAQILIDIDPNERMVNIEVYNEAKPLQRDSSQESQFEVNH